MAFLRNTWYVAMWSCDLPVSKPLSRTILGERIVFFRGEDGELGALRDRCPHRFAPLSMGKACNGGSEIACGYHGLRFDRTGACVYNPHGNGEIPTAAIVQSFPVCERYSAIWIWMGDAKDADTSKIPEFGFLDGAENFVGTSSMHIAANYELETDNIMDLSHIEFMHPIFSSDKVSSGKILCEQQGDTVWSKRYISDDRLPEFLERSFGFPEGALVDRWLHVRWDAPACMALWSGAKLAGEADEAARIATGAHLFTPETESTTHYFFAASYPRSLGPHAEQLARDSIAVAASSTGPFVAEDKPMVEAQALNMGGAEFWSLRPVLLVGDAPAIRARRLLARMIADESGVTQ